jgi:hypothetical protein
LMLGIQSKDGGTVPAATPDTASYDSFCSKVAALPLDKLSVACTSGSPLTVNVKP